VCHPELGRVGGRCEGPRRLRRGRLNRAPPSRRKARRGHWQPGIDAKRWRAGVPRRHPVIEPRRCCRNDSYRTVDAVSLVGSANEPSCLAAAGKCSSCTFIAAACRAPRPSHPHTLASNEPSWLSWLGGARFEPSSPQPAGPLAPPTHTPRLLMNRPGLPRLGGARFVLSSPQPAGPLAPPTHTPKLGVTHGSLWLHRRRRRRWTARGDTPSEERLRGTQRFLWRSAPPGVRVIVC
jgi:hypothetical protein